MEKSLKNISGSFVILLSQIGELQVGGTVALAADAVGAAGAGESAVGAFPEALGMELEGDFPNEENY